MVLWAMLLLILQINPYMGTVLLTAIVMRWHTTPYALEMANQCFSLLAMLGAEWSMILKMNRVVEERGEIFTGTVRASENCH